ncbi:hypothetical protein MWT96_03925 [Prescottella equi]|nr:hypothetical protein [Prescottella equi]MCU7532873.1 hypothetical protein [Prescottella equi]UPH35242.1 hypothetical protein GS533_017785 [Prescottella equi]UPH42316.1 hypothetical protein MWT96_03925 [Prescottella equi]
MDPPPGAAPGSGPSAVDVCGIWDDVFGPPVYVVGVPGVPVPGTLPPDSGRLCDGPMTVGGSGSLGTLVSACCMTGV